MRCRNCTWAKATHRGLCFTCYMYERRTGRPRPWKLIVRSGERMAARGMR